MIKPKRISTHPSQYGTALSPNNYHVIGDITQPWMFFSYFETTNGRQLLTLHLIPTEQESIVLNVGLQNREFDSSTNSLKILKPFHTTTKGLFDELSILLPGEHYINAVKELVLNGTLTDFAKHHLDFSIAKQQHLKRTQELLPLNNNTKENLDSKRQSLSMLLVKLKDQIHALRIALGSATNQKGETERSLHLITEQLSFLKRIEKETAKDQRIRSKKTFF